MVSTRAEDVAEVLWELKRADKVATFATIAKRAGFSAGPKGRAVKTALKTVRRDWEHLQWWRAVGENGSVEKDSEHAEMLTESGYELIDSDGKDETVVLTDLEGHIMTWEEESEAEIETDTTTES